MSNAHENPSPKGRLNRRTALIVAGVLALVIVGFFVVMSVMTLSTTPTPDETPREATVSSSAPASPEASESERP